VYVDLKDNLTRHPKSSAYWFKKNFFQGSSPTFTAQQKAAAAGKGVNGTKAADVKAAAPTKQDGAPPAAKSASSRAADSVSSLYHATLSKVKSLLPFSLDLHSDVLGLHLQLNTGDDATKNSPQ
jgi:hypothetical protein